MIKGLMEYLRVLFLFLIYTGVISTVVTRLDKTFEQGMPVWLKVIIGLFFVILFFVWYRAKGQYTGWLSKKQG